MRRRIIFRCDASKTIGGGHLMRCQTLAAALRREGWDTWFAVSGETYGDFTGFDPLRTLVLPENATDEATAIGTMIGACDKLVIDHYPRGASFEQACRAFASGIVVFDDLADRPHAADLLIDSSGSRRPADYAGLVPTDCRLAIGPRYAPLRPAFARQRPIALARRERMQPVRRILIAFGATDPDNHTAAALQAIDRSGLDVRVDVVLGAAAPHLPAVQRQVASRKGVRLWIDANRVASLMAHADIAFGAAGTSAWERCCLGLPAIVVAAADNQRTNISALIDAGAAVVSDGGSDDLARRLMDTAIDCRMRQRMAKAAARLCDGLGVQRLLIELEPEPAGEGVEVRLQPVVPEHCELLYRWQCQPETRRYALIPRPPAVDEHADWFARRLADPDCLFNLVVADGEPVGFVRLDSRFTGLRTPRYEVSIAITADRCGAGLGSAALRLMRRLVPEAILLARIKPENGASRKAFQRVGYRPAGDGWFHSGRADRSRGVTTG